MSKIWWMALMASFAGASQIELPAKGGKNQMPPKFLLRLELDNNEVKVGDSIRGQIQLENLTKESITITSFGCLRMYVDFTIKDDKGKVISTPGRYGAMHCTSPGKQVKQTIAPGEYFAGGVLPSEVLTKMPLAPGEYSVQAHFQYPHDAPRIDSETVRIKVVSAPGKK